MIKSHGHPAGKSRLLASIVVLLVALLTLTACETTGPGGYSSGSERRAARLARDGQHREAASIYMHLAADDIGVEKDRLTLLAVEQWLDAGDVARARSIFDSVTRPVSAELLAIWSTNSAAMALYRGEADDALNILEPMSRQPLSRRDRLRVEALRADAWVQKKDPARAVELMMQRENWLDGRRSIEQNRRRLWQGLLFSNPLVLREATEISLNPVTRGWLSLGSLATATGQQGIGWNNGVVRWREDNPGHPAMTILAAMPLPDELNLDYPRLTGLRQRRFPSIR